MAIIDSLAEAFLQSYDDKYLSKAERKALRQLLNESALDKRKRDLLRAKIFDIVDLAADDKDDQFSVDWLESATRLLDAKSQKEAKGSKVYFSPGQDCYKAIVSEIGTAKRSVDICVFTISDNRISDTILGAQRRGIKVRVLTDNDKLNDKGSDIAMLAEKGLDVKVDRTSAHMHHKFAVIDDEIVITGSYNWTRSAAEYNEENLLVTQEKGVVRSYLNEFNQMWKKMEVY